MPNPMATHSCTHSPGSCVNLLPGAPCLVVLLSLCYSTRNIDVWLGRFNIAPSRICTPDAVQGWISAWPNSLLDCLLNGTAYNYSFDLFSAHLNALDVMGMVSFWLLKSFGLLHSVQFSSWSSQQSSLRYWSNNYHGALAFTGIRVIV